MAFFIPNYRKEAKVVEDYEKNFSLEKHYFATLSQAVTSFSELIGINYSIKVARKGLIYDINLSFHERNFVHLAGIDKLTDIAITSKTPNIFLKLLKGDYFSDFLKEKLIKSKYFESIIDRLYSIIDLRENFHKASDNKHYKFISKDRGDFTLIDYDFIIKCDYGNDIYYYFLRKDEKSDNPNQYVLVSLFMNNVKDYTKAQAYMTLLKKIEIDRKSGGETVIYKR